MRAHDILRKCLEGNNLQRPDGRPLYRYDVSDEATANLAGLLQLRLSGDHPLDRTESAGFCLVLAKRGVPILNADALTWPALVRAGLGYMPDAAMNGNTFRAYTDAGMGWWGRTPIRVAAGTRWLTTLWCEGAGPLNLIQRDYNAVRTFFHEVLRVHTEYPTRDLDAVIEEEDHRLPDTLRNGLVRDLTREVVREATKVRDLLTAGGGAHDPLQWLSANDPSWFSRWPFAINDGNSEVIALLLGLIRQRPRTATALIQISTVLETLQQSVFELRRTLQTPARISTQSLLQLAEIDAASVPPQQWWILAAGTSEHDTAKVVRSSGENDFRVVPLSSRGICGTHACRQIKLVSRRGSQPLFTSSSLPGSNALPEGLWVFVQQDDGAQWRFVGSGSCTTQHPTLLFALPTQQSLDFDGQGSCEAVGSVRGCEPSRTVYRLSGDIDLFLPDAGGIARLRTNAVGPQASTWFTLRGKSMTLGFGGTFVWCGLPTLCEIDGSGTLMREIPLAELEWRPTGAKGWARVQNRDFCLGRIQIRYAEDEAVLYRQEMVVLPQECEIHLRGTTQPRTATVRLRGLHPPAPQITPSQVDDAVEVSVDCTHSTALLTVTSVAGREVPPTFRCRFSWPESRSAEVDIATPVSDVSICDTAGRRSHLPGPIPVQLLDGLYLRAAYPTPCSPVIVDADGLKWAELYPDSPDGASYTLPLSTIAERARGLLATQDSNDGVVVLRVRKSAAVAAGQVLFRISRTAGRLLFKQAPDGECLIEVPENARQQPWLQGDIRLELSRLTQLDVPLSDSLCRQLNTHSWQIASHALPSEGVLATARGLSDVCLTPVFVPSSVPQIPAVQLTNKPLVFNDIVQMQSEAERFVTWRGLLRDMSLDPAHSDWENLIALLAHATTLPETTYNVVEALSTLPQAAAACVVRNQTPLLFWKFMERLSFLWSLVPLSSWIQAVHRHATYVRGISPTIDLWTPTVQKFVSCTLRSGQHCMRPILDCLARCNDLLPEASYINLDDRPHPENVTAQLPPGFLQNNVVQPLASRLVDESANNTWPTGQHAWLNNEHVGHLLEAFGIQHGFLGAGVGYRRAVICAPLFAAARVAYGHAIDIDKATVRDMIRYRAFDRDWYDEMQSVAVYYLLSRRLAAENDLLTTLASQPCTEGVQEG